MKKGIIFILLLMFSVSFAFAVDFTVDLTDDYGDGWNGGTLDVTVAGTLVLNDLTIVTGYGPETHTFAVNDGDLVELDYVAGSWAYENAYYVYDNLGNLVVSSGDGGVEPLAYVSFTAVVGVTDAILEGYVYEFGGAPIEGAVVTIAALGLSGTTLADGSYSIIDIIPNVYDISCAAPLYITAEELGFNIVSGTNTLDFDLLWSEIAVDVTELESYILPDETEVQTFTITNDGPGDLEYSIGFEYPAEIRVRQVPNTQKAHNSRTISYVPNQPETKKMNTNLEDNTTAEHLSIPSIPSRDAGDILSQFNPPMSPWGVGFDGEFLWLTDAIAADPNIHQYATDGTATGATLNCSSWMGSWVGDMAYTPGYIFAVNVGGDNNIYKLDETTGAVAEIISGEWNTTSARGLAYDPANDEFYIGGWNHTLIYHVDATGATISTIPFASVSGLGWHPSGNNGTGSLWVTESSPANNIYELDPTTGAVLQSFTSPGADYACAGLEVDNVGNLWVIDQGTNTVYNIDSGVPLECWVSCTGNPSGVVLGNGGSIEVEVTFDSAELLIGDVLTADLLIHNNSNYTRGDDYVLPVTLDVGGAALEAPTNVSVDPELGLLTWDAPSLRDLIGYNVYLDNMTTPIGTTTDTEYQYEDLVYGEDYIAGVSAVYDDGESEVQEFPFTYTGADAGIIIPLVTELTGNYPNPFNPTTTISFSLKEAGHVSINIYNMRGQLVKTLVNAELENAYHEIVWNGKDNSGKSISSGVYFYKMKAQTYNSTKKMILMK